MILNYIFTFSVSTPARPYKRDLLNFPILFTLGISTVHDREERDSEHSTGLRVPRVRKRVHVPRQSNRPRHHSKDCMNALGGILFLSASLNKLANLLLIAYLLLHLRQTCKHEDDKDKLNIPIKPIMKSDEFQYKYLLSLMPN